jgi:hypothetical protein
VALLLRYKSDYINGVNTSNSCVKVHSSCALSCLISWYVGWDYSQCLLAREIHLTAMCSAVCLTVWLPFFQQGRWWFPRIWLQFVQKAVRREDCFLVQIYSRGENLSIILIVNESCSSEICRLHTNLDFLDCCPIDNLQLFILILTINYCHFLFKFVNFNLLNSAGLLRCQIIAYFYALATPQVQQVITVVDRVGGTEKLIQQSDMDGLPALKLNVSLDTPIIIMPRNSQSEVRLKTCVLHIHFSLYWAT